MYLPHYDSEKRAYVSDGTTMISLEFVLGKGSCSKEFMAMLYMGFKDKNGKEIYQGDIFINHWLKRHGESKPFYTQEATLFDIRFISSDHKDLEVIGNVHENPKLKYD